MIRRIFAVSAVLAAVALTGLVSSSTASAAPYPPSTSTTLSASAYDPCAGASNIISGDGFQAGETVLLDLAKTGEIGRPVADATGSFEITVTIPLAARGSDQVTAVGLTSGRSARLTLSIPCVLGQSSTALDSGGNGGLAYTGVAVGAAVLAGLVLLGAGGAFVVAGRRRRSSSALG